MASTTRMPRIFAAGAALASALLLSGAATAQDARPPYGKAWEQGGGRQVPTPQVERLGLTPQAERLVDELTRQLQLSTDQAAHVRRILDEEHAELQARQKELDERRTRPWWGTRGGGGRGQGSPPLSHVLRQRSERQIERVLSDAQRARYRTLRGEADPRGANQP